jgi:hypothetical protein
MSEPLRLKHLIGGEQQPLAGGLFKLCADVRGLPQSEILYGV